MTSNIIDDRAVAKVQLKAIITVFGWEFAFNCMRELCVEEAKAWSHDAPSHTEWCNNSRAINRLISYFKDRSHISRNAREESS